MSFVQYWTTAVAAVSICYGISSPGACGSKSFTMWQLQPHGPSQLMMSYVIQTAHGRVIAIDGGIEGDAPYLKSFLKNLGGKVDAWFVTHPHSDHCDALTAILKDPGDLQIDRIFASFPDEGFIRAYEPECIADLVNFNDALTKSGRCAINLVLGARFEIDGVRIDVLGIRNPEFTVNAINNSSVVLRVSDQHKSVLFLADLGAEGGEKLLHSKYGKMLKSDYMQMAHHGQNGVGKDVYEAVAPKACFWPTPDWLWDNNIGKGKNSGPWKTLEVRKWIEDMGIATNYVPKDGLFKID